jgi:DNA-binding FadR family transcriptional regulator
VARHRREREPVRFERLEQQRAHEYVAEQIRRQIVLRLIPTGQALPPERELATMFGVGLESRRGRHGGGNFVVGPDESRAGMDALLARLRAESDRVREALAYRGAVEPAVAGIAAVTRSRSDLRRLREAHAAAAAAEPDAAFMQADTAFHLALAEATGNRFLREAIMTTRLELNDALVALPESHVWHERSVHEHEAIARAVADADRGAATAAMDAHVAHTAQSVEALLVALARRPRKVRVLRG